MMPLLQVDDIHTFYGNIEALKGISLEVEEGEVVTLIGSNGAGKSTTLRSISGLTPPRTGTITFDGNDISATPPQDIVQLGISQSPEGRHCFQRMSVRENLELGAYLRRNRAEINEDMERVFSLFPRLQEREKQKAGTMSGGEQQMLAIGRSLLGNPKLLLVDEPVAGMTDAETRQTAELLKRINQDHTVVVVEHDMAFVRELGVKVTVLHEGAVIAEGSIDQVSSNERVIEVYLGR